MKTRIFGFSAFLPALALLVLLSITAQAQKVYTWTGAPGTANGNLNGGANWSPTRRTALETDILVFDGSVLGASAPVVTVPYFDPNVNPNANVVGQMHFINGVNATLLALGSNRTVTINGSAGDDFLITSNSKVTLSAGSSNHNLVVTLGTDAKAAVSGALTFVNTASGDIANLNSQHRLTGSAGSITFLAGSNFLMDTGAAGVAFGTTPSTAIFDAGATYTQNSGSSPLGGSGNATIFSEGSFYVYKAGDFAASTSIVRTFGNLEFQNSVSLNSGTLNIKNHLKITNGTLTLGTSSLVVGLNGTIAQTISGAGALALGANTVLDINNPAGVTLSRPLTVFATLGLTNGRLTTTAGNRLTLAAGAGFTGGSVNSFVNGALTRALASATSTALVFPIGSGTAYRPLALTLTQSAGTTTTYTAQQFEGPSPVRIISAGMQRVSAMRYYNLTSSGATTLTNCSIRLSFNLDDQVDAASNLRVARGTGTAWVSQGGTCNPGINGTTYFAGEVTSSIAFTQLGDFVLASTVLANGAGTNPLPVELTAFKASRQGSAVNLYWTTASEKNSQHFVVERSEDGRAFRDLGTVAGHGTTTVAHTYTFTDQSSSTGLTYYRLRQVDFDGTQTHSPVAVVAANGLAGLDKAVYPNPCAGYLTLPPVDGRLSYRIYTSQGQAVLSGQTQGGRTIDLSRVPGGSYLLELTNAGQRRVQRFTRE
ncbi:T9SS type A sorting domain-containing protein [Hymenobacter fastidiosus]|uniref:T9SS type A sorting domain-containing protein n=1 Tax=Hymenobacter fastidiosus TaxID=486264 RepID=A0ABP7SKH1_9BACT